MKKKPVDQSLNVFCETLPEGPDLKPKREREEERKNRKERKE